MILLMLLVVAVTIMCALAWALLAAHAASKRRGWSIGRVVGLCALTAALLGFQYPVVYGTVMYKYADSCEDVDYDGLRATARAPFSVRCRYEIDGRTVTEYRDRTRGAIVIYGVGNAILFTALIAFRHMRERRKGVPSDARS